MIKLSASNLLALIRISMGWIFLWAFFDKVFGLGFATTTEQAWLAGGSPTSGFLSFATKGPFKEFFSSFAGNSFIDWFFMLTIAGIGVALILGVAMRLASYGGALWLALMYVAGFMPPVHNPFLDEHLVYALIMIFLPSAHAGRYWGFGHRWDNLSLVKRFPFLR